MRATLPVALLALALLLPAVAAQAPDAQELANGTVEKGKSLVDKVAAGLGSAAKGVGDAAGSAADGVGSAAGAVGRFVQAVARAVADGTLAALHATTAVAGFLAGALASLATTAGLGAFDGLGLLGSALGQLLLLAGRALADGAVAAAQATGSAFAWIGAQLVALGTLYASLVGSLRPKAVPMPAFAALASAGTAATAAVSGYGLLHFLRRFGWLAGLPGLAGFSRIEDDELLKHPLRAQVFQVIQGSPGIHASELGRRMGTGWGTIVHHLDKLEKGRLVAVRKVNNQKCYFEAGGKISRQDMAVASAVRGDSANRIAGYVAAHPMTSQKALAGDLGISPALASFHVKKLVGLGVLDKVRHGKETLLTTTDALRRIVAGESAAVAPPVLAAAPSA